MKLTNVHIYAFYKQHSFFEVSFRVSQLFSPLCENLSLPLPVMIALNWLFCQVKLAYILT